MTPRELQAHRGAPKLLKSLPVFKPMKRKQHPKPFDRMGGGRVTSTGLLDVSADHAVFFLARGGALLSDSAFYGFLMCKLMNGRLSPLFEFHWHASHKGFHGKFPCDDRNDYSDRLLPGARELSLRTDRTLDPRSDAGRNALIIEFCKRCGIHFDKPESAVGQTRLWN
jgi:hypothetical protein